MNLETLSTESRKIASALFSSDETRCSQKMLCMEREESRPLTKAEKMQGWTRRPFGAYNADFMCAGCRAYWFAEMAAQQLHEMRCWQIRAESETARTKAAS